MSQSETESDAARLNSVKPDLSSTTSLRSFGISGFKKAASPEKSHFNIFQLKAHLLTAFTRIVSVQFNKKSPINFNDSATLIFLRLFEISKIKKIAENFPKEVNCLNFRKQ